MIKRYENISRREFLDKFFSLWNVLLPETHKLTNKEVQFLTEVLLLPTKYKYSRFSTAARKVLTAKFKESGWELSPQGFSQLVKSLMDKGIVLIDSDDIKYVHPKLEKSIDTTRTEYLFQFQFKIKE